VIIEKLIRRFTESDKQSLRFSQSAAIAVEYNRTIDTTQRLNTSLDLLNRITTTAVSALSTTDLVETSLEQILLALGQPGGALKISDATAVRGLSLDASIALSDGLHIVDDKFTTTIHVSDWREERGGFLGIERHDAEVWQFALR
jgi:hypothetical protein